MLHRWLDARAALLGTVLLANAACAAPLEPCRIGGVAHEVLCGTLTRPLDPDLRAGPAIDVHYAVVPAAARRKAPDPVFLFAGGPGQSAIDAAPQVLPWLARLNNRRDIVLIDQRGTGRSAPLVCGDDSVLPPAERFDPRRLLARVHACRDRLARLPHGDLRRYTTAIAAGDADAVRRELGAGRINLVAFSYGTRVGLEMLRRFPDSVRSAVLDGVAPPDMALPASYSADAQAALDALFESCEAAPACRARHPRLRLEWQALLRSLPRAVNLPDPLTGEKEPASLTRAMLLQAVRGPLYASATASALPHAIEQAARGNMQPLTGLASLAGRSGKVALGMHFSVVCAEDMPLVAAMRDAPGADFGTDWLDFYRDVCDAWPRAGVAADFYRIPPSAAPVLILSGAIDPVTPPRHGERVRLALGSSARHVIVPNTGHNVLALGCMRDVLTRFVEAESAAAAPTVDATCVDRVPRPPAFEPVRRDAAR